MFERLIMVMSLKIGKPENGFPQNDKTYILF